MDAPKSTAWDLDIFSLEEIISDIARRSMKAKSISRETKRDTSSLENKYSDSIASLPLLPSIEGNKNHDVSNLTQPNHRVLAK